MAIFGWFLTIPAHMFSEQQIVCVICTGSVVASEALWPHSPYMGALPLVWGHCQQWAVCICRLAYVCSNKVCTHICTLSYLHINIHLCVYTDNVLILIQEGMYQFQWIRVKCTYTPDVTPALQRWSGYSLLILHLQRWSGYRLQIFHCAHTVSILHMSHEAVYRVYLQYACNIIINL
jgi:hypothetical protein